MTFRELQDTVLRDLGYNPESLAAEPRDRIKDRINVWHRRLLTRPVMARFLREAYTLTLDSVVGQATYGLPAAVERVLAVRDVLNDRYLPMVPLQELREADPGLASEGVSELWALRGHAPVHHQPAVANNLVAASTSTSDRQRVTVEYLLSDGTHGTASAALNGTTAVAVGTMTTVVEVLGFDLAASGAGAVTLYEDSVAGTVLATIPAGLTTVRHWWIQLYPTPTAVVTYTLDVTRRLLDLLRDGEEPLLPADFHDVLALAVQIEEWQRKGDLERAALFRHDYDQRVKDLDWWVWNQPTYQPGRAEIEPPSRLGSWYPRGS